MFICALGLGVQKCCPWLIPEVSILLSRQSWRVAPVSQAALGSANSETEEMYRKLVRIEEGGAIYVAKWHVPVCQNSENGTSNRLRFHLLFR
jgi:hypothetical protein